MNAAKLGFMKLIISDMAVMKAFYEAAFGFVAVNGFDTPEFEEIMLRQGDDPFLFLLLRYKDGRQHPDATAHGPTGFVTEDIQASVAAAVAAGAIVKLPPFEVGPTRVAFLADPEGHEIEIIQFL
jgi:lactoylglutathione lyase